MAEHYTQDVALESYPVVVGLTRPATFKGVPINYAMMSMMIVGIAFIYTEKLQVLLLYGLFHAIGYALQVWDPRFIDIVFLKMKKGWTVKNKSFWGGNSYSP